MFTSIGRTTNAKSNPGSHKNRGWGASSTYEVKPSNDPRYRGVAPPGRATADIDGEIHDQIRLADRLVRPVKDDTSEDTRMPMSPEYTALAKIFPADSRRRLRKQRIVASYTHAVRHSRLGIHTRAHMHIYMIDGCNIGVLNYVFWSGHMDEQTVRRQGTAAEL